MYRSYRDRVAFLLVYIREAHPSDGWQVQANLRDNVIFKTPTNFEQRTTIAHTCRAGLELSIPMVIDGMDNAVEQAYTAWPDRLYVVDIEGKIAYKGGPGPGGFHPEEMRATLDELLAPGDLPNTLRIVPAEFPGKPSTSVRVWHPWDAGGPSNLLLPENLWIGDELIFSGQNWVKVEAKYPQQDQPTWKEIVPHRLLHYEHRLGEEYVLQAEAKAHDDAIELQLVLENRTNEPLENVRAQVCFSSQQATGFASQDLGRVWVPVEGRMTRLAEVTKLGSWGELKKYVPVGTTASSDAEKRLTHADIPLIALVNADGAQSVGVTWQGAKVVATNLELSCIHADPYFPQCPANGKATVRGRIFFTKGTAQQLLREHSEETIALQNPDG